MLSPVCTGKKLVNKPPDIIFILADDLGYGDLSCLNQASAFKTPNIDRIAKNGLVFTDAHSGSAVSTPTRYGILTGRYSWRSTLKRGVLDGYSDALIDNTTTTMASMLRSKGYYTAFLGKWHLGWKWAGIEQSRDSIRYDQPILNGPVDRGFDYFFGFSASLDMPPYIYVENSKPSSSPAKLTSGNNSPVGTDNYDGSYWREGPTGADFEHENCTPLLFDKAVQYISERSASESPYFLFLSLPSPHTPIVPDPEFKGRTGINPYADFVVQIDHEVGELVKAVENTPGFENTIIIFTSDNGPSPWADFKTLNSKGHYPNHIFRGHKADLYEGGHHVPCIMSWPAVIKQAETISQTFSLNDFMATFAAVTGYKLSDNEAVDSYNFLPAIIKPSSTKIIREATVHHSVDGLFAIRRGDWKLLFSPGSGGWSYPRPGKEEAGFPPVQLYNLTDDPSEKTNLASVNPAIVNELTELLEKYISIGRSTPGRRQKNDGVYPWEQIRSIVK